MKAERKQIKGTKNEWVYKKIRNMNPLFRITKNTSFVFICASIEIKFNDKFLIYFKYSYILNQI